MLLLDDILQRINLLVQLAFNINGTPFFVYAHSVKSVVFLQGSLVTLLEVSLFLVATGQNLKEKCDYTREVFMGCAFHCVFHDALCDV